MATQEHRDYDELHFNADANHVFIAAIKLPQRSSVLLLKYLSHARFRFQKPSFMESKVVCSTGAS